MDYLLTLERMPCDQGFCWIYSFTASLPSASFLGRGPLLSLARSPVGFTPGFLIFGLTARGSSGLGGWVGVAPAVVTVGCHGARLVAWVELPRQLGCLVHCVSFHFG